jgi:hypothetical protein
MCLLMISDKFPLHMHYAESKKFPTSFLVPYECYIFSIFQRFGAKCRPNYFSVTKEVLSLRQQLSDSHLNALERQKLMEKAAQLAADNVALKSEVDEIRGMKAAAEEHLNAVLKEAEQR